jgi:hypothetical protein
MPLVITRDCQIYWNYQVCALPKGTEIPDGEFATYLRSAGGAPIEEIPDRPAVDTDGDGVPDGTIGQVVEWVGADLDRAALALTAEKAKGDTARSTLVAALTRLLSE